MEAFFHACQKQEMNINFAFVDKSKNKFVKKYSETQNGKIFPHLIFHASQKYEMNTKFAFVDKSKNKSVKKDSETQKGKIFPRQILIVT